MDRPSAAMERPMAKKIVYPNGKKFARYAKMRSFYSSAKGKAARTQAYAGRKYRR